MTKSLIPTLDANMEDGEGAVLLPDGWRSLNCVLRADLLQDWMDILGDEYELAVSQFADLKQYKD